jgi:hypothetical protein
MRIYILLLAFGLVLGCNRNSDQNSQGTSGSGANYGRGGAARDDQQRAQENATDQRPRGGRMQGAGGAGPGYDGSGKGSGKEGTVPAPGSGVGAGLTNSAPQNGSSSDHPGPGQGQQR